MLCKHTWNICVIIYNVPVCGITWKIHLYIVDFNVMFLSTYHLLNKRQRNNDDSDRRQRISLTYVDCMCGVLCYYYYVCTFFFCFLWGTFHMVRRRLSVSFPQPKWELTGLASLISWIDCGSCWKFIVIFIQRTLSFPKSKGIDFGSSLLSGIVMIITQIRYHVCKKYDGKLGRTCAL